MKNQKGFIVPLAILIIVLVALGGGMYVYSQNKGLSPNSTESQNLANQTRTKSDSKISVNVVNTRIKGDLEALKQSAEVVLNKTNKSYQQVCEDNVININSDSSVKALVDNIIENSLSISGNRSDQKSLGIECFSSNDAWVISIPLNKIGTESDSFYCVDSKGNSLNTKANPTTMSCAK